MSSEERKELEIYLAEVRKQLELRRSRLKAADQALAEIEARLKELGEKRVWQRGGAGEIAELEDIKRKLRADRERCEEERKEVLADVERALEREQLALEQLKQL